MAAKLRLTLHPDFPMVYTRILTLRGLPTLEYYLWLALYNVVYVVPPAVIVADFTYTLGGRKLQEEEGRLLKLVSGNMMLGLGLALLFAPQWQCLRDGDG